MALFSRSKPALLLLAALVAWLDTAAQQPETFTYAMRDTAMRLDVWRPASPRPDSACVVAAFGGGFVSGRRNSDLQCTIARELTGRGFTVVSFDYRLGLQDTQAVARYGKLTKLHNLFQYAIDLAVEDCSDAVAWLVGHSDALGISPQHIVLTGSSAGAITVLQTDYCRANSLPQASALPQGWKPLAVVPYAGAIFCPNKALRYATPPAPTMFLHGKKDKIVAYRNLRGSFHKTLFGSPSIFKQMRKQGFPAWIIRVEGIGHEVASYLPASADLFCGFVDQVLAGRATTLDATMTDPRLEPTEWTTMNLFDLYAK